MYTIDELKNYPNNWVNGMMITSSALNATDLAWNDAIRDVRVSILQGFQYGLLPPLRDTKDQTPYPKFYFDHLKKELTLLECRGITEGGYRIEITEILLKDQKIPLVAPSIKIDYKEDIEVFITVDMSGLTPSGALSSEAPPRYLYKSPGYELSVFAIKDQIGMAGVNHMKIAEFKYLNDSFVQDEKYIPPSLTLNSHPLLVDIHKRIGSILNSISEISMKIVQIYRLDSRPDVKDGASWVQVVLYHFAAQYATFNDTIYQLSPIHFVTFLKNWTHFTTTTLALMKENSFLAEFIEEFVAYNQSIQNIKINLSNLKPELEQLELFTMKHKELLNKLGEKFRKNKDFRVEVIN